MKKKHLKKAAAVCLILAGLGMFFYPDITSAYINMQTQQYVKAFDKRKRKSKESDPLYQKVLKYNQKIAKNGQKDFKDAWSYKQPQLSLSEMQDFGYIKIPKMDVKLPLYLGAANANMEKGAVILGETSLPIGGKDTNSVIAAHRGYQGIPYFREIEKLKVNDKVFITNPWETLTYRVEAVKIIQPDDTDAVKIQKGKDMVTLITCHPYRVGKVRYIVSCVRDKGQKFKDKGVLSESGFKSSKQDILFEKTLRYAGIGVIIMLAFFIIRKGWKNETKM